MNTASIVAEGCEAVYTNQYEQQELVKASRLIISGSYINLIDYWQRCMPCGGKEK